tara:strand:- start:250 stop:1479 length:1230 start_codon:yes stop_codon:yes gene_type:complete
LISRLEKEIIFRFLKTRKQDNFLNIITIFSFIGISLGVAVLIIVMSVMNGFRTELINKIVGFNSHLVLSPYEETIDVEKIKKKEIYNLIDNYFYTNKGEAVILQKNYTKGIMLRGYEKNSFKKLSFVNNDTFSGSKRLNSSTISIGKELSYILNVDIGDKVTLMSPAGVETLVGNLPKQETFIINSIFDSGLIEFDQNVAFLNINDLESFFNLNSDTRDIEFYLINPENIENAKNIFQISFNDVYIYTWADLNKSLFSALKIERNVMFIILSLIIIVAAFNIISGLTILVKNKTRDIAILRSIGVSSKSIKKIFFMVGFLIGLSSTVFGIFLGILFSINIEKIRIFLSELFNITIFPEEIYFLSKMPTELNPNSILIISICSILITSLVSIYPAIKASNIDPIKSLKYE